MIEPCIKNCEEKRLFRHVNERPTQHDESAKHTEKCVGGVFKIFAWPETEDRTEWKMSWPQQEIWKSEFVSNGNWSVKTDMDLKAIFSAPKQVKFRPRIADHRGHVMRALWHALMDQKLPDMSGRKTFVYRSACNSQVLILNHQLNHHCDYHLQNHD